MERVFAYALFAMLFWGTAPLLGKTGLARVSPYTGLLVRTLAVLFSLVIYGLFRGELGRLLETDVKSLACLAGEGILASLLGHLAYFSALKYGAASRVVPFTAAYPLVTFVLSLLVLGERLTLEKAGGALLVTAGLFFLAR